MKINIKSLTAGVMVAALALTAIMPIATVYASGGGALIPGTYTSAAISANGAKNPGSAQPSIRAEGLIPAGEDVTVSLSTQYMDSVGTLGAKQSVAANSPVQWQYCQSACSSVDASIGNYVTFAYTAGGSIHLSDVASSTTIRAIPMSEGLKQNGDPIYPAYITLLPLDNANPYKMYAGWSTSGLGTGYVIKNAISNSATSIDPAVNRVFTYEAQALTSYYEINPTDSSRTLSSTTTLSNSINAGITYVAVTSGFEALGLTEMESNTVTVDDETSAASNIPAVDESRTYTSPVVSPEDVISEDEAKDDAKSDTPQQFAVLIGAGSGVSLRDLERADVALVDNPSGVVLQEGASFKVTGLTSGGSAKVKIALEKYYKDLSVLSAYKSDASGDLSEITDAVSFTNESGVTYLSYELKDGGAMDEDGTANGTIVDPVYVGVDSASLADTGTDATVLIGIAFTMIGFAVVAGKKFLLANS